MAERAPAVSILVDRPRWPAHGQLYGHLVSDSSLWELHAFARAIAVDARAFDHDHYDLAERYLDAALAAGAELVDERELVRRLRAGGLRISPVDHAPRRGRALVRVRGVAVALLGGHEALVDALLARYTAPTRRYHDVRHLDEMLRAQRWLAAQDATSCSRPELLATLWHDAICEGVAGRDEQDSGALAVADLGAAGLPGAEVDEVERLVLLTVEHRAEPFDGSGARLCDADMAILGSAPGRYHVSTRDIRLEYCHLTDDEWRRGRAQVLRHFLDVEHLFSSPQGRARWEAAARRNIADELAHLDD